MKPKNKQGISLIVLVITIIVMIILAAAVILSLSSSGIIGRANEAQTESSLAQVKTLATTIWAEIYLENREGENYNFATEVQKRLKDQGIDTTKYNIVADENGVTVELKDDKALIGDGQTFYRLAPTTLTFISKLPRSEFQAVKINGETLETSHYTVSDAETGISVTLSLDYLKTLNANTYSIEVVSANLVLHGTFTVVEPEKNENGFYYNQPYTAYVSMFGEDEAFFICDDGTLYIIGVSSMSIETGTYTLNGNNLTVTCSLGTLTGTVSADGTSIYCNELGASFKLGNENIVADEDYVYIYKDALDGYEVICVNKTKASYGAIRTGINGKPTVVLTEYMFAGNKNLIAAPIVPDGVTAISKWAFYACESLTSITIPDSLTSIEVRSFMDCPNLTKVVFGENSQLTSIGEEAFLRCSSLNSITIPDGVTSIGVNAFGSCTNLSSITIPDGVTVLSGWTFYECASLTSVTFEGNSQLTSIGSHAFAGCSSLTGITIPAGVTSIDVNAFFGCSNLTEINFEGTKAEWNSITKGENWNHNIPATQVVCSDGTVSLV